MSTITLPHPVRHTPDTISDHDLVSLQSQAATISVTFPDVLTRCVEHAVAAGTQPRPGQQSLALRMLRALLTRGQSIDEAPTGTGKSLASLTVAGWMAMEYEERTVISTHSLALLDQYVHDDAPAVTAAFAELGMQLEVASLKGANNYVDPRRLLLSCAALLGQPQVDRHRPLTVWREQIEQVRDTGQVRGRVAAAFEMEIEVPQLRELLLWGLDVYLDADATGDRQSCPVPVDDRQWRLISELATDAATDEEDGFGWYPKAQAARDRAAQADIVVTNHVLPALQAANGIPVVVGSKRLGRVDHLIIDEAHTLPGQIRSQGSVEVSGGTVARFRRAVLRVVEKTDPKVRAWVDSGSDVAAEIDRVLRGAAPDGRMLRLSAPGCPLDDGVGSMFRVWLEAGRELTAAVSRDGQTDLSVSALRVDRLREEMVGVLDAVAKHRVGVVRWIEVPDTVGGGSGQWAKLSMSPVDVASSASRNLWWRPVADPAMAVVPESRLRQVRLPDGGLGWLEPLGVACVSATLPVGFAYDAGIRAQRVEHPSPFADAYAGSMLLVPGVTDAEVSLVAAPVGAGGRPLFDTRVLHPEFVRQVTARLIRANGGRALVLTARAADGRALAAWLRERLEVPVFSQWDGGNLALTKRAWIADEVSVLVGTRSLMTGVDAPGETCSLVIVDRPPRAAGNPVDDARVEVLMESAGMSKWDADRWVYVSDAAAELQQAVGRLIRSTGDRGLVAVLDPRLLAGWGLAYPAVTRRMYLGALGAFSSRCIEVGAAEGWLRDRREVVAGE